MLAIYKAASQASFASLFTKQRESVARFVSGNDAFVSLPTGAVVCYIRLLPLFFKSSLLHRLIPPFFDSLRGVPSQSIIVVVSPLNSLKDDQVAGLLLAIE